MKKVVLRVILGILVILLVVTLYQMVNLYRDNKATNEMIEIVKKEVIINSEVKSYENNDEAEDESSNGNDNKLELDFNKLRGINSDTVAYINVSGTNIAYPIVQTKDNDYYLNHSFDKSKNVNGWPFLNSINTSDFSDQNSIIFGHNTNGKTMFSEVKGIYEGKYGNDIDIIIYREDEILLYKVFAVYLEEPDDTKTISRYLTEETINDIRERSNVDFGIGVSKEDKILTLSTCHNISNKRIILNAVRVG